MYHMEKKIKSDEHAMDTSTFTYILDIYGACMDKSEHAERVLKLIPSVTRGNRGWRDGLCRNQESLSLTSCWNRSPSLKLLSFSFSFLPWSVFVNIKKMWNEVGVAVYM